ncbi:hypothetical protein NUW58_g5413 [Xylaria curta]|uniref:Uncharacterized protein n=1 Tax=Xylaria curta TaxID=42375 RepID=A0ACC1P2F8_9PEZI|nr:hypothetical protein NUW58_g5413 [Xylaria curta]
MAHQHCLWSGSEQAADPLIASYETGHDCAYIEEAMAWNNGVSDGPPDMFDPAGLGVQPIYTDPARDIMMLGLPSNQIGQEVQPQVGAEDAQESARPAQGEGWDYVVEVWPGIGDDHTASLKSVVDHIYRVNAAFEKKGLDYHLSVQDPVTPEDLLLFGPCRRYVLPRQYRDSERSRLKFLQVFNVDRLYNKALEGYQYKMSVVYEQPRNPLPTRSYSSPGGGHDHDPVTGFNPLNPNGDPTLIQASSPTPSTNSLAPTTPTNDLPSPNAFVQPKARAPKSTQPRMKPIPKPQRPVVKNQEGKFICTWKDCDAAAKEFTRKCEWSKHMDKHERPYKCLADGCENVPGFTYSGGLLRHEREVHRKHGGPKNPLYCPHKGCKRHKDSSFARLENLNEHLRRCHTTTDSDPATQPEEFASNAKPTRSRVNSLVNGSPLHDELSPLSSTASPSPRIGSKRKADDDDLREENKRLRFENQELKRKIEAGYLQQGAMMDQIDTLEKERADLLAQLRGVELVGRPIS